MKKMKKSDLWTIPNMICYLRILLIPVFVYLYFHATTLHEYYVAIGVVIFSSFTDLFDGMIARRFHQVTELGKVLDPVADKLTHAALALCLALRYPLMRYLLILMLLKEGYMAIMGAIMLKRGKMLNGAMWYGKVCTALLFIGMVVMYAFPTMDIHSVNIIIVIIMAMMAYTWLRYIIVYQRMLKEVD